ncbi:MAG: helix-turn-helix transcriptional regulator [Betaproteobacteria bacterium]|nr:helix-turn-helix transcriptional regulator [Betaproteobacteria bacterium]
MTISTRHASTTASFGPMLREWRKARGASQLDLALNCGLSQRHLSFLESGRSRPSRGMVLHLASALDVPLGQQNAMLLCAGFAPVYKDRGLDAADMRPVDLALDHALRQQEPYPALVVDHAHYTLRANRPLGALIAFLTAGTGALESQAPMNGIEILLNPEGLRPFVENWEEVAVWSIRRLRAEATLEVAGTLAADLLKKMLLLPGVGQITQASHADRDLPPTLVVRFRKGDTRLALFSMIATMGTPLDVSLQNLRLELFFPADDATAGWFAQAAKSN